MVIACVTVRNVDSIERDIIQEQQLRTSSMRQDIDRVVAKKYIVHCNSH